MTVSSEASAELTAVTTSIRLPWPWTALAIWVSAARVCSVALDMTFCNRSPKPGPWAMSAGLYKLVTVLSAVGMAVILFAIALTGVYVRRANREFDARLADVLAGDA